MTEKGPNALMLFPGKYKHCVNLGREYYSQQYAILAWLHSQGEGDVNGTGPTPQEGGLWAWEQLFGHQYIAFATDELYVHFQLVWANTASEKD